MIIPLVDLAKNYQSIKKEIDSGILRVTNSAHFILGPEVEKFEQNFAKFLGAKYCVGLDSGISSLELGLRALEIGSGDEVLTPVNSFIASSSAISFAGATPVWVDIDPITYNIDPKDMERKITKKTKAIMPVHLYGQSADMEQIMKIAKKYKLLVLEDACQSHGASFKGKKVGTFGDAAAFSFYPGKNLGAFGDAGALVTNNKKIADRIRQMRNYGQIKKYHHQYLAWNRRLDELQASILNVKLKYLDKWNDNRRQTAIIYNKLLSDLPITLPTESHNCHHVYHLYVIQTNKRDKLLSFLNSNGIQAGIHYPIPIHHQEAYMQKKIPSFPVTEEYSKKILSLPIYPGITKEQINYISLKMHEFFQHTKV